MKKFFIEAAIFIAILFVADRGVGIYFRHLDTHLLNYPIDYQTVYTHLAWKIDEEVVIIGNSRARHQYDANRIQDSIGMTVINAGKDGNRLILQSCMIQNMLKRHTPKCIIWETDPIELMKSELDFQRISDLNPFYEDDSLSRSLIESRGWNERYKMMSYCYRNNGRLPGLLEIKYMGKEDNGLHGYAPVKNTGYKYPKMRVKELENSSEKFREDIFIETIAKAKSLGCRVIIASTPQYEKTNIKKTLQYERFSLICDSMDVPWINHLLDDQLISDPTYFKDASHLNGKGVDKYMELFIPELKEYMHETD